MQSFRPFICDQCDGDPLKTLSVWFLLFITYSFGGWLMEVIVSILTHHKLINRGFLVGPICPIYGVGAVLIALILGNTTNWLEIFLVAVIGSAALEYAASFIMEKLFRVRWWDYSEKKFNLRGRICLESILSFGIIGIVSVRVFIPALINFYSSLRPAVLYTATGLALALIVFDIILSLWLILGVRVTVGTVQKDATGEISERVKEILTDKGKLNRRLVKAFPKQTASPKKPRAKRTSKTSKTAKTTKSTEPKIAKESPIRDSQTSVK